MSLWETIDELLDESDNVTNQHDQKVEQSASSDEKIYDDNELDQNEFLGLEYEEDDFGLLGDQMETVEEKPKTKSEKDQEKDQKKEQEKNQENEQEKDQEKEQERESIDSYNSKEPEKQKITYSPQSSKHHEKKNFDKTNEKTTVTNTSPIRQSRHKKIKQRTQIIKNFAKNDGILPIPTQYLPSSNVPTQSFMPNLIFSQMAQFPNPQFNFNEIYNPQMGPYHPNPYRIYDQGYMYPHYPFPNQPSINNYQNEMRIPASNQFIQAQYNHFNTNNLPRKSSYGTDFKAAKSDLKEEVAKKPNPSRSRKELDLLLEKRLAQLEKERIEEEKIEQTMAKRKLENGEKRIKTEVKSESESLILAQDPDYIKKMEEQKRKREEILRQKEEKRNQRISQMSKKNENIPDDKAKVQNSSSDNRIIKNASKRLITLKNTDKKILDMSNSLGVRTKNSS
ncbi:hypothetical protein BpHYR1_018073 [Brachionus plicatilis]|uniref:Uncharacterized protein n=1 Tax=Brachionus plicatilis TaxID=10195 RepID=A0A3M7R783_BRAPC|nr:hypothetical protein BpHYR1_018073 [Brachionus plicatilis]